MAFDPNASQLSQEQILQQVFDPVNNALRTDATVQVDTIHADLSVDIKASDGDNIAIANADGSKVVTVTTVGPHNGLDVNIVNTTPIPVSITATNPGTLKSLYNEITSVSAGLLTTINTYTVPVATTGFLQKCAISGTNVATYTLLLNSVIIDKKYTVFGSSFNESFVFADNSDGLPINSGDVVQIKVIHNRPSLNDFNGRIQVIEVT